MPGNVNKRNITGALRAAAVLVALMTVLTGFLYPLFVMAVAQTVFNSNAGGSLIVSENGEVKGSALLGQEFTKPKYFWSRLSATTPVYNAAASGGSNFSPANPALLKAVRARVSELQRNGGKKPVPVDLVTASGSGLDPHISLAAAEYQIERVARARGIKEDKLRALVQEQAQYNFLSDESYVNVLLLNLSLDRL